MDKNKTRTRFFFFFLHGSIYLGMFQVCSIFTFRITCFSSLYLMIYLQIQMNNSLKSRLIRNTLTPVPPFELFHVSKLQ